MAQIEPIRLAQNEPLWSLEFRKWHKSNRYYWHNLNRYDFHCCQKVAQIKPKCLALTDRNHWHNSNRNSHTSAIENCELAIATYSQKSTAYYWKGLALINIEDYRTASFAFIKAQELGCEKSSSPLQDCLNKFTEHEKKFGPNDYKPAAVKNSNKIKSNGKQITSESDKILFVNYTCNLVSRITHYPILKIPKKGSVIRSHSYGKTNRRGFKEEDFQKELELKFASYFEVSGNVRLNLASGGEFYEPDIALISKTDTNIRIVIEIDEPYSGIDRLPTHFTGEDHIRDTSFINRGWVVIRFSELQVHKYTTECVGYLASVINSLDHKIRISRLLDNHNPLNNEPLWSYDQCKLWAQQNYRESYLDHIFKILPEKQRNRITELTKREIAEEELVINEPLKRGNTASKEKPGQTEKKIRISEFETSKERIKAIQKAILTSKNIQFNYQKSIDFDNGKRSIRTIKPQFFEDYPNSICIKGYCYGREAEREFNVDRISELIIDPREIIHWEEDDYGSTYTHSE